MLISNRLKLIVGHSIIISIQEWVGVSLEKQISSLIFKKKHKGRKPYLKCDVKY